MPHEEKILEVGLSNQILCIYMYAYNYSEPEIKPHSIPPKNRLRKIVFRQKSKKE